VIDTEPALEGRSFRALPLATEYEHGVAGVDTGSLGCVGELHPTPLRTAATTKA